MVKLLVAVVVIATVNLLLEAGKPSAAARPALTVVNGGRAVAL